MYHQVLLSDPFGRLDIVDRPGLAWEYAGQRQEYPVDGIMVPPS